MSETISLVPGLLVTLSTRIEGGATYTRTDLEHDEEDGRDLSRWETTRVIQDRAEFEEAGKVRGRCRKLIEGACVRTPFGFMICPLSKEGLLDQRIAEAKAAAAMFNSSAEHSRVRITTMRGSIAASEGEAAAAVQTEVGLLLDQLQAAVSGGKVGDIRDVATRATQLGKLLEQKTAASSALNRAVASARRVARGLRKVGDDAEGVAQIIENANTSAISSARFLFIAQPPGDGAGQEADVEMPPVAAGRFAALAEQLPLEGGGA